MIECPNCHVREPTTACRFCGISKLKTQDQQRFEESLAYREEHARDENWGEIQADDLRRIRGWKEG
jgi:hypothetical protein